MSGKLALAVLALGALGATTASAETLSGTVTDTTTGAVVSGALVYISGSSGLAASATTDAHGRYGVTVEPGTYYLIFVHGRTRSSGSITVAPGRAAALDGVVDVTSGEIIVIEEKLQPPVPPTPKNFIPSKTPPYSDAAVLSDAWTSAWMLLDVDERGVIQRYKFLKHPGYDLEQIARREVSQLELEPARDATGKPIRAWMVWQIEWPSAWWLEQMVGTRSGMPPIIGYDLQGKPIRKDWYVPCRGSGPLNLGSIHPVYKDCSKPDLTRAVHEPWLAPEK
jgi:carboxypeptidase family protein